MPGFDRTQGARLLANPATNKGASADDNVDPERRKAYSLNLAIASQLLTESIPQIFLATKNDIDVNGGLLLDLNTNAVYVLNVGSSILFAFSALFTLGTWLCSKGCNLDKALQVVTIPMNSKQKRLMNDDRAGLTKEKTCWGLCAGLDDLAERYEHLEA